jgi:hypothetical protein
MRFCQCLQENIALATYGPLERRREIAAELEKQSVQDKHRAEEFTK